jgi:hypothetical protein
MPPPLLSASLLPFAATLSVVTLPAMAATGHYAERQPLPPPGYAGQLMMSRQLMADAASLPE